MKHYLYYIVFLLPALASMNLFSQVKINTGQSEDKFDISVNDGVISGEFSISSIRLSEEIYNQSTFLRLAFVNSYRGKEAGLPDLPYMARLVEVPVGEEFVGSLKFTDSIEIDLNVYHFQKIMPVSEPLLKRESSISDEEPRVLDSVYFTDGWFHPEYPEISSVGRLRGVNVGQLAICPVRYNPGTGRLLVYTSGSFEYRPLNKSYTTRRLPVEREFEALFKNVELENSLSLKKRLVSEGPLTMVILSDTLFRNTLQPLIDWKKEKGFNIIEAYTTDAGVGMTADEIKEFMHSVYTEPPQGYSPPSYLMIAGDVQHVPLSQSSGQVTDLYYTCFDGPGDFMPELFHGRLSASSVEEMQHIVDKILTYEKFGFPDPSFLERSVLIAGYDASYGPLHGNGQINYAASYYFNSENNIDARVYLHPEASASDAEIFSLIGEGNAVVNYTGHGEYYGWYDPALRTSQIDTLKNTGKYGLMIGNGCSTNQFNMFSNDCFAEAIVKAENKGAVGYIGCTNDSYWDEDYYWSVGVGPISPNPTYESTSQAYYDKVFHSRSEAPEIWAPSLGEMLYAGNMAVTESMTSLKKYYWEIYQLMGDPSLVPWLSLPGIQDVSFPTVLPVAAKTISLQLEPFSYAALSHNGILMDAGHADEYGQITLMLSENTVTDSLLLVITADDYRPYIDTVIRGVPESAYLELDHYSVVEESFLQDNQLTEKENFSVDLDIINRGNSSSEAGNLVLFCLDTFVVIQDSIFFIESIPAGDTLTLASIGSITIRDSIPDKTAFRIGIRSEGSASSNLMFFKEKVLAPELKSLGLVWEDRPYGNGNGYLDPDEVLSIRWQVKNTGSYRTDTLAINEELLPGPLHLIRDEKLKVTPILPGETVLLEFTAEAVDLLSQDTVFAKSCSLKQGIHSASDSLFLVAGKLFEDFSSAGLSVFPWFGSNTPWTIDSIVYRNSPYALKSGEIDHASYSTLAIELATTEQDDLSFSFRVSSEEDYDFLVFLIDSVVIDKWSGYIDWTQVSFPISAGEHLLEWRYQKDANTIEGEDCAWIDNIIFPGGSFSSNDLSVIEITAPSSSPFLTSAEYLSVKIRNCGEEAISDFILGYRINGEAWSEHAPGITINSGAILEYSLPGTVDLSAFGTYSIGIYLSSLFDEYHGNDTMYSSIDHTVFNDLAITQAQISVDDTGSYSALLELSNQGNQDVEKVKFDFYIDGNLVKYDSLNIALGPGEVKEVIYPLDNLVAGLSVGQHSFEIISIVDDHPENNSAGGTFVWNSMSGRENPELFIYPNPVSDMLFVRVNNTMTLPVELRTYSSAGKLVSQVRLDGKVSVLSAESVFLESGMYNCLFIDANGTRTIARVIFEKN